MDRWSEKTFFQRRHTDGQQAREKILSITNHQENEDQNQNEISLHICQNGYYLKKKKTVGEVVEKREICMQVKKQQLELDME